MPTAPAPAPFLVPRPSEQLRLFDYGPDLAALRAAAVDLGAGVRSSSTTVAYASDWKDFEAFCARAERKALPASEDTLCMYVADGLNRLLKVSTLQRRLLGLLDAHKRAGAPWAGGVVLRDVMRGARRSRGSAVDAKAALGPEDLRAMCVELLKRGRLIDIRDRALLTLGFCSGMRRSELCALDVRDLQFVRQGVVVTIRRSKTDQEGHGRAVGVFSHECADVDPIRALQAWLDVRGRDHGRVFPGRDGRQLTGEAVWLAVKRACGLIGLDKSKYGAHSLRAGFVTTAAELGMPETLIMQRTGHKSVQTVARYVRPARLFQTDALARAF